MDPIDGTKAFIRGQQYAINLCLLDAEARQVLAVVGCPKLDPQVIGTGELVYNTQTGPGCLFFALRGHSAYAQEFTSCDVHNSAMLPARKLPNLSRVDLSNNSALRWMDSISIPCTGALQGLQRRAAGILSNKPQEDGPTYLHCDIHATILKWVFMATGNAQAWSRISGERAGVPGKHGHGMIWDYAGAMLLFEEVGGKVTDLEGRDINLSTGRKIDMSHGFVSAVAEVQGELLAATRKAVSDMGREDLLD
jgi:3'(2'), 5'-bisphosphate nucleotidase